KLRRTPNRSHPPVENENFYRVLEASKENDEETEESGDGEERETNRKVDGKTLPPGNIVIVGDSQVRYLDREFCDKDRKRRTRVCFPGAGIGD
ncbi:hypothetical protein, partial [Escherichia coli]|uniref:hypothetical protein n=1 Tax=Escherichia coli TaxID=562 RepID=UPI003078F8F0